MTRPRYLSRGTARGSASQNATATPGGGLVLPPPLPSPKPKRKAHPEAELQAQIVATLRLALPVPWVVWFCPNGGNLAKAQRSQFKRMGLTPGVHDLHVIGPGFYGTLEAKRPDGRGRLSPDQIAFGADMDACGHPWREVCTVEAALDTVAEWVKSRGGALRPITLGPAGFLWDRGPR